MAKFEKGDLVRYTNHLPQADLVWSESKWGEPHLGDVGIVVDVEYPRPSSEYGAHVEVMILRLSMSFGMFGDELEKVDDEI